MAVEVTPLGFQKPDGSEPFRQGNDVISANAQKAQDLIAADKARLALLEQSAGFPGDPVELADDVVQVLVSDTASATAAELQSMFGTFISPLSKGAAGDGITDDSSALAATLTAASAGTVIDLGGRTFKLGQTLGVNKKVTLRNGILTSSVDRVATVSAAGTRLENVQAIRTGPATVNSGALAITAPDCVLVDVTATSTYGEGLRLGNGSANGTKVRGGYFATSDPNESFAIQLLSGSSHNYDVKVSGATIRNTGYGSGIGFYNCSRCAVENNDVRGMRRSPWFVATGWTLVSGTVYRALDRTDVVSNAVYVNDVEYRKNTDPNTTAPALNFYTTPGDGHLYINTGVDPSTQVVKTTRTNGYGILMYATTSESLGMRDNLITHNYVEDTDGFGIYYQTLENTPKNNRTLQNTLRNVCLTGVTVADLPFAGIGVFGGLDVQLDGDIVDGCGSPGTPAPGVKFKQSVGVPHMTGSLRGVTVKNATGGGICIAPGTWKLSAVTTTDNAGAGIFHGTVVAGDLLDVELVHITTQRNTAEGLYFETTTTGELRPKFIGGKYADNNRNLVIQRCRDVFIGGGLLSYGAASVGISVGSTCQRVVIDGLQLRSGVGLQVQAGVTDLTIGTITHDGSSGTKVNVNGQPYKEGGATGYATRWVCVGTPEGQITAPVGSRAVRTDGGAGTTSYVKESGAGNTGWVAK